MSKQHNRDPEFTALQKEMNNVYHQQNLEQPSVELDEAILAKARSGAHVSAPSRAPKKSLWQRNAWLFSSAASVLLVAGLFMLNPNLQQQIGIELEQRLLVEEIETPSIDASVAKAIAIEGLSMSTTSAKEIPVKRELTNVSAKLKSAEAQPALMSAAPQQKTDATQTNALQLQLNRQVREEPKTEQHANIQLDTANLALAYLQTLVDDNKLIEAERYRITVEQRFPELSNASNPLYEQYQKIKVKLTSQ
ncbi:hypothetical protein ACWXWU_12265 [Shewanella sp. A14]